MTDEQVLELAAVEGFDLRQVVTEYDQRECWGWVRYGEDRRWPAVRKRLSTFFEQRNYTNVRGLFLFGY